MESPRQEEKYALEDTTCSKVTLLKLRLLQRLLILMDGLILEILE